ncbi:hypothetical protein SK128_012139, partial [Halocaridina rubra]
MAFFAKPQDFLTKFEECYVSSFKPQGPWKFNMQFKQQKKLCQQLHCKLPFYYHTAPFPASVRKGSNVLCCLLADCGIEFYRGMITSVNEDDNFVSVYLVDRGTVHVLSRQSLRLLPPELLETPVLMYRCILEDLPPVASDWVINGFCKVVMSSTLMAKIISFDNEKAIKVRLLANGQDVLKKILEAYENLQLIDNDKVTLTAVYDNILYVQLVNNNLKDVQSRMQVDAENWPVVQQPTLKQPCIAKFHDEVWYRAVISEVGSSIKVKYVDFGNTDCVPVSNIREIESSYRNVLPAQAVPCILHQIPKMHFKTQYIYQCLGSESKTLTVKIKDVMEEVIEGVTCLVYEIQAFTAINGNCLNTAVNQMIFQELRRNQPPKRRFLPPTGGIFTSKGALATVTKSARSSAVNEGPDILEDSFQSSFASIGKIIIKPNDFKEVVLTSVGESCFFVTLSQNVKPIEPQTLPPDIQTIPDQAIRCTLSRYGSMPKTLSSLGVFVGGHYLANFVKYTNGIWEVQIFKKMQLLPAPEEHLSCEVVKTDRSQDVLRNENKKEGFIGNLIKKSQESVINLNDKVEGNISSGGPIRNKKHRYHATRVGSDLQGWKEVESDEPSNSSIQATIEDDKHQMSRAYRPNALGGSSDLVKPRFFKKGILPSLFGSQPSHRTNTHSDIPEDESEAFSSCTDKKKGVHGNITIFSNKRIEGSTTGRMNQGTFLHSSSKSMGDNNLHTSSQIKGNKAWESSEKLTFSYKPKQHDGTLYSVGSTFEENKGQALKSAKMQSDDGNLRSPLNSYVRGSQSKDVTVHKKLESIVSMFKEAIGEGSCGSAERLSESRHFSACKEDNRGSHMKVTSSNSEVIESMGCETKDAASNSELRSIGYQTKAISLFSETAKITDMPSHPYEGSLRYNYLDIPLHKLVDVYVSHVESPIKFYCRISESRLFEIMNTQLQKDNMDMQRIRVPLIGEPVIVQLGEDQVRYRARVLSQEEDCRVTVECVDYGKKEQVEIDALYHIDQKYMDMCPANTFCVTLLDIELCHDTDFEAAEAKLCTKAQVDLNCRIEENLYKANKILTDGESYAEFLMEKGFAVKKTLTESDFLRETEKVSKKTLPKALIKCGEEFPAYISHIHNDGSLWIQAKQNAACLEMLMNELYKYGKTLSQESKALSEIGTVCISQYPEDEQFYRVIIQKLHHDSDLVDVIYVDYGNTDSVLVGKLWTLPDNFFKLPIQAIHCHFSRDIRQDWNENMQNLLEDIVNEGISISIVVEPKEDSEGFLIESLIVNGVSFVQKLTEPNAIAAVSERNNLTQLNASLEIRNECDRPYLSGVGDKNISFIQQSIKYNQEVTVTICHIHTDGSLWISLSDQSSVLGNLMDRLNEVIKASGKPLGDINIVDRMCVAQYSEDGRYYRAVVKTAPDDLGFVEIHYVDYGNSETIRHDELLALPSSFCEYPAQAVCCHYEKDIKDHWSKDVQKQVEELSEQEVTIKLTLDYENNENIIAELRLNGKDVLSVIKNTICKSNKFHECGSEDVDIVGKYIPVSEIDTVESYKGVSVDVAHREEKDDCLEVSTSIVDDVSHIFHSFKQPNIKCFGDLKVHVCHIEMDGSFWVQMADYTTILKEMMDGIHSINITSLDVIKNKLTVGCVCLSRFSLDGRLYRAVVKDIDTDESFAFVHYVDYGNSDRVQFSDLYILPEIYRELDVQAIRCYIQEGMGDYWSETKQKHVEDLLNQNICISLKPGEGKYLLEKCISSDVNVLHLISELSAVEKNRKLEQLINENGADPKQARQHISKPGFSSSLEGMVEVVTEISVVADKNAVHEYKCIEDSAKLASCPNDPVEVYGNISGKVVTEDEKEFTLPEKVIFPFGYAGNASAGVSWQEVKSFDEEAQEKLHGIECTSTGTGCISSGTDFTSSESDIAKDSNCVSTVEEQLQLLSLQEEKCTYITSNAKVLSSRKCTEKSSVPNKTLSVNMDLDKNLFGTRDLECMEVKQVTRKEDSAFPTNIIMEHEKDFSGSEITEEREDDSVIEEVHLLFESEGRVHELSLVKFLEESAILANLEYEELLSGFRSTEKEDNTGIEEVHLLFESEGRLHEQTLVKFPENSAILTDMKYEELLSDFGNTEEREASTGIEELHLLFEFEEKEQMQLFHQANDLDDIYSEVNLLSPITCTSGDPFVPTESRYICVELNKNLPRTDVDSMEGDTGLERLILFSDLSEPSQLSLQGEECADDFSKSVAVSLGKSTKRNSVFTKSTNNNLDLVRSFCGVINAEGGEEKDAIVFLDNEIIDERVMPQHGAIVAESREVEEDTMDKIIVVHSVEDENTEQNKNMELEPSQERFVIASPGEDSIIQKKSRELETFQECSETSEECSEISQECSETSEQCFKTSSEYSKISQGYCENSQECSETSLEYSETFQTCFETSQECSETFQKCSETSQVWSVLAPLEEDRFKQQKRMEHQTPQECCETFQECCEASREYSETSQECSDTSQECSDTSQECSETSQERFKTSHECCEASQKCSEISLECCDTSQECFETSVERCESSQECSKTPQERCETFQDQSETFQERSETSEECSETCQGCSKASQEGPKTSQECSETSQECSLLTPLEDVLSTAGTGKEDENIFSWSERSLGKADDEDINSLVKEMFSIVKMEHSVESSIPQSNFQNRESSFTVEEKINLTIEITQIKDVIEYAILDSSKENYLEDLMADNADGKYFHLQEKEKNIQEEGNELRTRMEEEFEEKNVQNKGVKDCQEDGEEKYIQEEEEENDIQKERDMNVVQEEANGYQDNFVYKKRIKNTFQEEGEGNGVYEDWKEMEGKCVQEVRYEKCIQMDEEFKEENLQDEGEKRFQEDGEEKGFQKKQEANDIQKEGNENVVEKRIKESECDLQMTEENQIEAEATCDNGENHAYDEHLNIILGEDMVCNCQGENEKIGCNEMEIIPVAESNIRLHKISGEIVSYNVENASVDESSECSLIGPTLAAQESSDYSLECSLLTAYGRSDCNLERPVLTTHDGRKCSLVGPVLTKFECSDGKKDGIENCVPCNQLYKQRPDVPWSYMEEVFSPPKLKSAHGIQIMDEEMRILQQYKAVVSYIDIHPFSLWVQKGKNAQFLDLIRNKLACFGKGLDLSENPGVGQFTLGENLDMSQFCLGENPDVGQYCLSAEGDTKHRVRLISCDDTVAHVHYVDLGKYGIVPKENLWRLDNSLMDIRPLASQIFLPVKIEVEKQRVVKELSKIALNSTCYCTDVLVKMELSNVK